MMNYFNLLPPEIIEFIFKKLNLHNLTNLRIVDKRFKEICEQIKIKQLLLSDDAGYYCYFPSFWFYTNDPIYFNSVNLISLSKISNYTKIFQLTKHLKRLDLLDDYFNFSILNEFKLLEQLKIASEIIDNYKLSLDHLKIVDIDAYDESDFKLTFDTIKLFAFRIMNNDSRNSFVFNYPDKILFFETEFNDDDYLKKFINLEYLKVERLYDFATCRNVLSQFKNLKILDLNYYPVDEHDIVMKDIELIINEKEKSRRSELEIYLNGVKLINQNKFNQFKFMSFNITGYYSKLLEFQIKNYDLLKDNCERKEINYNDLIKLIKIIPSSFTNKFPFIYQIKANDRIDNEDQFIKFLTTIQYLTKLELKNCELTKSFYHKLVYLKDLKELKIDEKKDSKMNFDFVLNLKGLKEFETNQIITNHIDLIRELFKENKNITRFIFKFDTKNYIRIYNWSPFKIESYYLDVNSRKVNNFSIDKLKDIDDVILILKGLTFKFY